MQGDSYICNTLQIFLLFFILNNPEIILPYVTFNADFSDWYLNLKPRYMAVNKYFLEWNSLYIFAYSNFLTLISTIHNTWTFAS